MDRYTKIRNQNCGKPVGRHNHFKGRGGQEIKESENRGQDALHPKLLKE